MSNKEASLPVSPAEPALHEAIDRLSTVLAALLGPDGCSWDKEQTPSSLTEYIIEECFELIDAIRSGKPVDIGEETGDVFFLLMFLAKLSATSNGPSLADAVNNVAEKMVRRHPHVFGDARFEQREDLLKNWERIKREEKSQETTKPKIYDSLAKGLPPLTKAYRIHAKAARVGFTWPDDSDVEQQVEAEWLELLDACTPGSIGETAINGPAANQEQIEHEFGDHLFSLVEFGRRKGIKAAPALEKANLRFLDRVARMQSLAEERGLDFIELSLDEKDDLWNEVKQAEKPSA